MKSTYFVGTYTQDILFGSGDILKGKGKGIYLLELDHQTGALVEKTLFPADLLPVVNPSYLCLSPNKQTLYSVNELKEYNGTDGGAVTAVTLAYDKHGTTSYLNVRTLPTYGADPCFVSTDHTASFLFTANYSGGSIAVYGLDSDGQTESCLQLIPFSGKGINPDRQECSHLHSVVYSAKYALAAAANLGTDQLIFYSLEEALQQNTKSDNPLKTVQQIDAPSGSGPRHSVFHPNFDFLYTTLELSSQIMVSVREADGTWQIRQLTDSYCKSKTEHNQDHLCADIHISPDGKFLYCSNRGINCISVFIISKEDGTLTHLKDTDSQGSIPRSFCLDQSGEFLLAANQDSDKVSVFRIEKETGELNYVSHCSIPTPVCIITS